MKLALFAVITLGILLWPLAAHVPPCAANQATYVVAYEAINVFADGESGSTRTYVAEYTNREEAEWALGRLRQTSGYSLGSARVVYSNIRLLVAYRDGMTEGEFLPPKDIDIDLLPEIPKTPEGFKKQNK